MCASSSSLRHHSTSHQQQLVHIKNVCISLKIRGKSTSSSFSAYFKTFSSYFQLQTLLLTRQEGCFLTKHTGLQCGFSLLTIEKGSAYHCTVWLWETVDHVVVVLCIVCWSCYNVSMTAMMTFLWLLGPLCYGNAKACFWSPNLRTKVFKAPNVLQKTLLMCVLCKNQSWIYHERCFNVTLSW